MDSYLINFQSVDKACPNCEGRILYDNTKDEYICQECGFIYSKEEL